MDKYDTKNFTLVNNEPFIIWSKEITNELTFVKWKWLITKDIDDLVIWAWFECSVQLYEQLHKLIDKVLTMQVELDWNTIELKCSICRDTKSYLQFVDDHWLTKLDLIVPDILLAGYILKWNIKLLTK